MRRAVLAVALVAGLLLVGVIDHTRADPGVAFEVGKPFPDLLLPSAEDGRPMSMAPFRGREVLRHVFASW